MPHDVRPVSLTKKSVQALTLTQKLCHGLLGRLRCVQRIFGTRFSALHSGIQLGNLSETAHTQSATSKAPLEDVNALLLCFGVGLPDPALKFDKLRLQISDRGLRRLRAQKLALSCAP